ncbi:MAG: ribonuclease R [Firmicutes bacterium]|nr:ribonuclease R [Bacillota bacterium]
MNIKVEQFKEMILNFIDKETYTPMGVKEISAFLFIPDEERADFEAAAALLAVEGRIVETRKGKIMRPADASLVPGIFLSSGRGFGFVRSEDILNSDIFIPPHATGGAMHKDRVLCRITEGKSADRNSEGEIIKILERGMADVVGLFVEEEKKCYVIPDEKKFGEKISIYESDRRGAVDGHKVVVKIKEYPDDIRHKNAVGIVTEILGHKNDPGVDILSVIYQFGLPMAFPEKVLEEVEAAPDSVREEDIKGREDLRSLDMITIDPEEAKDFDDAVSLELLPNGNYSLGVHIADVTHYVREGTALDEEAFERGTSYYLVDRVIPMLPHKLSNGICSLNPNVDRLALSCIMELSPEGDTVSHRIVESVIHSNCRLAYSEVNRILTYNDEELSKKYADLVPMMKNMEILARILIEKREKRGSVNFDLPESKIILDENGKIKDIKPYERNIATRLIEEFMLICNETVAEDYYWQQTPFVFRNHEAPAPEKLPTLKEFLRGFGYSLKGAGELHPKAVQQVLKQAEGSMEEHIISRMVLRNMKQASYGPENLGHFGLAAQYYCHFTSPIRRYPDLQIHRIIKENINVMLDDERRAYLDKVMPFVAKHSSVQERTADEAERETDKLKKAEFMMDKIGEIFEGMISGLTNKGIFVELPNTVEGFIALERMDDDRYEFDGKTMTLKGTSKGKTFHLGDRIRVKVEAASTETRRVDFSIAKKLKKEA